MTNSDASAYHWRHIICRYNESLPVRNARRNKQRTTLQRNLPYDTPPKLHAWAQPCQYIQSCSQLLRLSFQSKPAIHATSISTCSNWTTDVLLPLQMPKIRGNITSYHFQIASTGIYGCIKLILNFLRSTISETVVIFIGLVELSRDLTFNTTYSKEQWTDGYLGKSFYDEWTWDLPPGWASHGP